MLQPPPCPGITHLAPCYSIGDHCSTQCVPAITLAPMLTRAPTQASDPVDQYTAIDIGTVTRAWVRTLKLATLLSRLPASSALKSKSASFMPSLECQYNQRPVQGSRADCRSRIMKEVMMIVGSILNGCVSTQSTRMDADEPRRVGLVEALP